MAKYKVGIYGVGDVATEYIKVFNLNPMCEVIAAVDFDKSRISEKAKQLDIKLEAVDDFEQLMAREGIDNKI